MQRREKRQGLPSSESRCLVQAGVRLPCVYYCIKNLNLSDFKREVFMKKIAMIYSSIHHNNMLPTDLYYNFHSYSVFISLYYSTTELVDIF